MAFKVLLLNLCGFLVMLVGAAPLTFAFKKSSCLVFLSPASKIEMLPDVSVKDPRLLFETHNLETLQIGQGNSGKVFLFKNEAQQFMVGKVYNADRLENLERDHLGLKYVQRLFDLDTFHSINFKVVTSEINNNFNNIKGQKALVMPYVHGHNLHSFLISTPPSHPLHQKAVQLYQLLVRELDAVAVRLKIRDEIRDESERYFQDHILDGLPMLIIEGSPKILIKTDNIIFNPQENSLTLIDPY